MNIKFPFRVTRGSTTISDFQSRPFQSYIDDGLLAPQYESQSTELEIYSANEAGFLDRRVVPSESRVEAHWNKEFSDGRNYLSYVDVQDADGIANLKTQLKVENDQGVLSVVNPSNEGSSVAAVEVPLGKLNEAGLNRFNEAAQDSQSVKLSRKGENQYSISLGSGEDAPSTTWHIIDGSVKSSEDLRPSLEDSLPDWAKADRHSYLLAGDFASDSSKTSLEANPHRAEEMSEIFELAEMDEDPNNDMACGQPGLVAFQTGQVLHFGESEGTEWVLMGNGVETNDGWIENLQLYEKDEKEFRSYSFEKQGDRSHTSVAAFDDQGNGTIAKRGPSLIEEFFSSMEH